MRRNRFVALLAALAIFALPGAAVASGAPTTEGVSPTDVSWKTTCDDLIFQEDDTDDGWTEFKIDPAVSGTYNGITITVNGGTLSWEYHELFAVIVKGGPGAHVYNYSLAGGATSLDVGSDSGLTAPANLKGNARTQPRFYDISNVTFCLEGGDV